MKETEKQHACSPFCPNNATYLVLANEAFAPGKHVYKSTALEQAPQLGDGNIIKLSKLTKQDFASPDSSDCGKIAQILTLLDRSRQNINCKRALCTEELVAV